MSTSRWPIAAWAAADAAVLVALRPHPSRLVGDLGAPQAWFTRVGADAALAVLAATALWLVALWLGVGLLAGLAGRLPGAVGRLSGTVAGAVLPRVLYRVAAGSAGLGLLLGPLVGAGAAGAAEPSPVPSTSAAASASVPAPTWPAAATTTPTPSAPSTPPPTSVPAPRWPHDASPSPPRPSVTASSPAPRGSTPTGPSAPNKPSTPSRPSTASKPSTPAGPSSTNDDRPATVTVRADDSLWLLAARRLGPDATTAQIAHLWPEWYAANRDVIGDDPDLIRPGQVLHAPATPAKEAR